MIIQGKNVNADVATIHKSINTNLKNKDVFKSENKDTAETGIRLTPPVPMKDCLYVFKNSSHVAKCSRILADDIIYNEITLTPSEDEPDEHLRNQVIKINGLWAEMRIDLFGLSQRVFLKKPESSLTPKLA